MSHDIEAAESSLRQLGFPASTHLASGMEGHVFRIDDGRVAKVWHTKSLTEVSDLKVYYEAIQELTLPFATPLITDIAEVHGRIVSIERALSGTTLQNRVGFDDADVPDFAADAVMTVLRGLNDAELSEPVAQLPRVPILGSLDDTGGENQPSNLRLMNIARSKVNRYGNQLRRSVENFDWIYERTMMHLTELPVPKIRAIHGDICTPNILLDDDGKVSAVLDWGFLSFFGDPAFEASVACGIYNMYGPHRRHLDETFLQKCVSESGFSRHRLMLYRALYAMLTSNAYSEDGSDGHYDWCMEQLVRDDVRESLISSKIE